MKIILYSIIVLIFSVFSSKTYLFLAVFMFFFNAFFLKNKKFHALILCSLITRYPFINEVLRNILFHILFFSGIIIYSAIGALIISYSKYIHAVNISFLPKILAKHMLFLCDQILNLKIEVHGKLPKNEIIAPQHQSLLEIVILASVVEDVTFVFKKEFLYIPFLGYCMKNLDMIPVDRSKYNPNWMKLAIKNLQNGKNLVIFPEGKRVLYNQKSKYKKGIFKLAKKTNRKIVPVYVNTGLFWPKYAFLKKPGTAILIFGKKIYPSPKVLRLNLKKLQNIAAFKSTC